MTDWDSHGPDDATGQVSLLAEPVSPQELLEGASRST